MNNGYRCYSFSKTGVQPGCRALQCETDEHARQIAIQLLRNDPLLDRLEVWLESDLAFRLNRHHLSAAADEVRSHNVSDRHCTPVTRRSLY
jgi:hypothetical protein